MGAEILYRRLMSVVDDYGRFYASLAAIRGACWPTHISPPSEGEIDDWMEELTAGPEPLLRVYGAMHHSTYGAQLDLVPKRNMVMYLEILNFHQQTRSKSKFPEHDINLLANAEQLLSTTRARTSTNNEIRITNNAQRKTPSASKVSADCSAKFEEFWKRYPRKQGKERAMHAWQFVATIENEEAIFVCLENYSQSSDVLGGATMYADRWLNEQNSDNWQSRWTGPAKLAHKLSVTERAILRAEEAEKNGTH